MKRVLVTGAGGFIGHHLVNRLKAEGNYVAAIDLKKPEFEPTRADAFYTGDLREFEHVDWMFHQIDEVYQLAADMGGAGFVFTGKHDADILRNNVQINLNVLEACRQRKIKKVFFASSACVYQSLPVELYDPHIHSNRWQQACRESDAYPANPDSDYGWEKLFSERLYQAYARNHGLQIRIGRYHNIFGPMGTWQGGREKAPAALCRKIAEAPAGSEVEIWGDGEQQRSFLFIDEAIEGTLRLMASDYQSPLNIGSSEMVSIRWLLDSIGGIAGKQVKPKFVEGPIGVRGRNSDNSLIDEVLGWQPTMSLQEGLAHTYPWIAGQVDKAFIQS